MKYIHIHLFLKNIDFQSIFRFSSIIIPAIMRIVYTALFRGLPSKIAFADINMSGVPRFNHSDILRDLAKKIQMNGIHIALENPSLFFLSIQKR